MTDRTFRLQDQFAFAELSGDYNPLHTDPLAARRMIFGSAVVHGIHLLLWALDNWVNNQTDFIKLTFVRAIFIKPLRLDEKVYFRIKNQNGNHANLELFNAESTVVLIEIEWDKTEEPHQKSYEPRFPHKDRPQNLFEDDIASASGKLELCLNIEAAARLFPSLVNTIPAVQIAILLGTTRLVGMRCPGMNSVYSELKLSASESGKENDLIFKVEKYDRRFRLIRMKIETPAMAGTIKAYVRPEVGSQQNFGSLKGLVADSEFQGQMALIIGGNRGLGEVTAKLLAAGGAAVKITYHRGEEDAKRIVDEITTSGGTAKCLQYDVLSPDHDSIEALLKNWHLTHFYYFATPFISPGGRGMFSSRLFNKFCDYYITGFYNIFDLLRHSGLKGVFYPSTVYIDELPIGMGEYIMTKSAGEILCNVLEKDSRNLKIYKPRLPRMGTDQTASLLRVDNQDPVPVMLEHLRLFRDISVQ